MKSKFNFIKGWKSDSLSQIEEFLILEEIKSKLFEKNLYIKTVPQP